MFLVVFFLPPIRGASTVNDCLPTFRTPSPYPDKLAGPVGKEGVLGGVYRLRNTGKKKKKDN